jgi:hypothetical protein
MYVLSIAQEPACERRAACVQNQLAVGRPSAQTPAELGRQIHSLRFESRLKCVPSKTAVAGVGSDDISPLKIGVPIGVCSVPCIAREQLALRSQYWIQVNIGRA